MSKARYRIGERIIAHIDRWESHYYKMATLGAQTGIERIRKDIFNETQAIRQLLEILEQGGTVEMEVGLIFPDIERTKEVITYVRPSDGNSSIEFIDLSPKLTSLEAKIDELAHFVIKRISRQCRTNGAKKSSFLLATSDTFYTHERKCIAPFV